MCGIFHACLHTCKNKHGKGEGNVLQPEQIEQQLADALRWFREYTDKAVRNIFLEKGELYPIVILFVVDYDNAVKKFSYRTGIVPAVQFFETTESKELLANTVIPELIEKFKPLAYVVASEGYAVKHRKGDPIQGVKPPSEHPDRMEVISCMYHTFGKSASTMHEILRPSTGKPLLREQRGNDWHPVDNFEKIGRFTNNKMRDTKEQFSTKLNEGFKFSNN